MGSKIGVRKVAAKRLGIPFPEYMQHIDGGEKHCRECQTWKPLDEFHVDNSRGDGRYPVCKECRAVDEPQHWLRGQSMPEETKRKISQTLKERYRNQPHHNIGNQHHLGHKHTSRTRRKIARLTRERTARGKDHYAYKDGRHERRMETRRSVEYAAWRKDVFERDAYTCQECGDSRGGNLNAHHIKPFSDFPDLRFDVTNGIALCEECHRKAHSA